MGETAKDLAAQDRDILLALAAAIRAQIARCWPGQGGRAPAPDGTVIVDVSLNRSGTVRGARVTQAEGLAADQAFRANADAAHSAVLRCAPFSLPAEQYGYWRELTLRFHTG